MADEKGRALAQRLAEQEPGMERLDPLPAEKTASPSPSPSQKEAEQPKGLRAKLKAWNEQRIADNTPPPGFDFNARPRNEMMQAEGDRVNFAEVAMAEDELYAAEAQAGTVKLNFLGKLLQKYLDYKVNRVKHRVNRKTYLWLCVLLGWCGIHRFYEKRWVLGLLYLALSWTGIGIAFALVDWMIAVPMKADEDGMIEI